MKFTLPSMQGPIQHLASPRGRPSWIRQSLEIAGWKLQNRATVVGKPGEEDDCRFGIGPNSFLFLVFHYLGMPFFKKNRPNGPN